MVKPGDRVVCGVCGLEMMCIEGCGCEVAEMICCGKPMRKVASKKTKPKKKAKKR
jgi:hypothetical protein